MKGKIKMTKSINISVVENGYVVALNDGGPPIMSVFTGPDKVCEFISEYLGLTQPSSPEKTKGKGKGKGKGNKKKEEVVEEDDGLLGDDDPMEDAPTERVVTKDELKDIFNQVMKKMPSGEGQVKIKTLFKAFGAAKLGEIKEEVYSELYGKAEELLGK